MVVGDLSLRHFMARTGYQHEMVLLSIAFDLQVVTVPERWQNEKMYLVKWGITSYDLTTFVIPDFFKTFNFGHTCIHKLYSVFDQMNVTAV